MMNWHVRLFVLCRMLVCRLLSALCVQCICADYLCIAMAFPFPSFGKRANETMQREAGSDLMVAEQLQPPRMVLERAVDVGTMRQWLDGCSGEVCMVEGYAGSW